MKNSQAGLRTDELMIANNFEPLKKGRFLLSLLSQECSLRAMRACSVSVTLQQINGYNTWLVSVPAWRRWTNAGRMSLPLPCYFCP